MRSVSTPRWTKDLLVVGPVNPGTAAETAPELACTLEWSAETLSERLRAELTPRAWNRLVRAAAGQRTSVEQFLRSCLLEVA